MRWFGSSTDSMNMSLSKRWAIAKDREARSAAVHVVTESDTTEQLKNSRRGKCLMSRGRQWQLALGVSAGTGRLGRTELGPGTGKKFQGWL